MMNQGRLRAYLKRFVPLNRTISLKGVQRQERFHAIVLREQALANRNQHSFSLVLFKVGNPEANGTGAKYLTHVLTNRIRLTDQIGWFDNQRIGALLPFTAPSGAQKFADDICQKITAKALPPECAIYTYPSKWFSNGNGHQAQLHFEDLSPEQKTITSRGLSVPVRHADEANNMFGAQLQSTDTTLSSGALSQAIEPFFLYPLPVWKRAMDVVCALFGLVMLSPFLILVAVLIKIVSPGPVFFSQQRVGYRGKTFAMLKFRTMHFDTDISTHKNYVKQLINGANNGNSNGPMTKLDNHPKIIPFGKIFRKMCIDELPQLINVLYGEMSLVGPRPPLLYEVEEYLQWHYARFDAVPGMTGLWQVSGKNQLSFLEMMQLDIQYSRKTSFWLDIIILLKTPLAIISQVKDSVAFQKRQPLVGEIVENA